MKMLKSDKTWKELHIWSRREIHQDETNKVEIKRVETQQNTVWTRKLLIVWLTKREQLYETRCLEENLINSSTNENVELWFRRINRSPRSKNKTWKRVISTFLSSELQNYLCRVYWFNYKIVRGQSSKCGRDCKCLNKLWHRM